MSEQVIAGGSSTESPTNRRSPADVDRRPRSPQRSQSNKRKRTHNQANPKPTIYSAVAGHITYRPSANRNAHTHTRLNARKPLAPPDVLFERYAAPDRYAEPQLDWYGAHRWLGAHASTRADVYDKSTLQSGAHRVAWAPWEEPGAKGGRVPDVRVRRGGRAVGRRVEEGKLPDSDLCKAVHRYASAYYAILEEGEEQRSDEQRAQSAERGQSRQRGAGGGSVSRARLPVSSFCSLDETALLAFAVLLEESMVVHVAGPEAGPEADGPEGWRALMVGLNDRGEEVADAGGRGAREPGRFMASLAPRSPAVKSRSQSRSDASSAADVAYPVRAEERSGQVARSDEPPSTAISFGSELGYDPEDY